MGNVDCLPPLCDCRGAMKLLDLFCCAGGAGMGYHQAGFEVTGVDINMQPNYPFAFINGNAVEYLRMYGHRFDAIHASPPCQAYSGTWRIRQNEHPDLIPVVRELLMTLGKPWVIENVPGAPLHDPIELCGAMFGLRTYRHRLFESNIDLVAPTHPQHVARQAKMGRPVKEGEFIQVVGNFSDVKLGREVMGMPWAARNELSEAIPTAYTKYIGIELLKHLEAGMGLEPMT